MIKIERTITIHRPVEEVFAYISDVQHSPQYISGQREAHKTSTGPMGVGTTFATSGKFVRRATMCEVTEFEPNRRPSAAAGPRERSGQSGSRHAQGITGCDAQACG